MTTRTRPAKGTVRNIERALIRRLRNRLKTAVVYPSSFEPKPYYDLGQVRDILIDEYNRD
jgi:hypothetical protein